jgi:D-alanyl-D-alanine carboxypeptidase/D-alanyl-D-alanine-endopeptidase (penicillin-binding protein 4)
MPARAHLRALIDSVIDDPRNRNGSWSILIVDPEAAETLYSVNPGKLRVPASNQKIVTAAVALRELGADFRFATRFAHTGDVRDGVVRGNLVVFGSGDPSFSTRVRGDAMIPLRNMADSLVSRGITRIEGQLRRGASLFTDSPIGFGWAWDDLGAAYGAPVGDLMFDEAFADTYVIVEGATDSVRPRPRRYRHFLDAFEAALAERGISVAHSYDWASTVPDTALTTLFSYHSTPLFELLPHFLRPSQNQIGEVLLRAIGRARMGDGAARADSGAAAIRASLVSWGIDSLAFVVRDGSGLSRHNLLSAETIVRVLDIMRRDPGFAVFSDALPAAGADGTLERRLRGTPAMGNVRGKTGSMDRVRAFSGYATAEDRVLLFSILANSYASSGAEIDAAMDTIVVSIVRYRR